jgi:hypothetical protein
MHGQPGVGLYSRQPMERTPASIVLTVAGTCRLPPSGRAWLQPDLCAVGNCARDGLTPLPAFSKVVLFSTLRGRDVTQLIVPLALEGGQT